MWKLVNVALILPFTYYLKSHVVSACGKVKFTSIKDILIWGNSVM